MYLNESTTRFVVIGTVFGNGYDCDKEVLNEFEGSRDGVWNKVSAHMEWIGDTMKELGEKVCKA